VGPLAFSVPLGRLFARPLADVIAAAAGDGQIPEAMAEAAASVITDRQLAILSAAAAAELGAWNGAMEPLSDDQWRTVSAALGLDGLNAGAIAARLVASWPAEVDLLELAAGRLPKQLSTEGSPDAAPPTH
jgi:hypothetical protein